MSPTLARTGRWGERHGGGWLYSFSGIVHPLPLSSKTASSANREYGKLLFLLQGCTKIARFYEVAQNLSDLAAIQKFQKRNFNPDQYLRTSLRCGTILDEVLTGSTGA
jgi:hypothetical protein